jgi:hypothetical protein
MVSARAASSWAVPLLDRALPGRKILNFFAISPTMYHGRLGVETHNHIPS